MQQTRRRKLLRLQDYDYSKSGAYFITICTYDRRNIFGEIVGAEMQMNEFGKVVESCWNELPMHYFEIELDEFVVMPNHMHGIIMILENGAVGAIHELPLPRTRPERRKMLLPKIMGRFKMGSAKLINKMRNTSGNPIWQRNYYEHIIRNEKSLHRIQGYIDTNPARWQYDRENSVRSADDGFDSWLNSQGKPPLRSGMSIR